MANSIFDTENLRCIKKCAPLAAFLLIIFLFYIYAIKEPSNNRNWEVGFQTLPTITIEGSSVTITNFRNYRYAPGKTLSYGYTNRVVDIKDIKKVWFVVEPFEGQLIKSIEGIAHT